jgi:protein-S-isoprenylcysteine O-methyltransferase Ste14
LDSFELARTNRPGYFLAGAVSEPVDAMQLALDLVVSAVSILVIASYSWSLRGHFATPDKMPPGAKLLFSMATATSLLFLYLLWSEHQATPLQIVGLTIELGGAALFWSAIAASRTARLRFAFDEEQPHSLVTDGPYKYLRHPFYSSYLVFWSGWAIATWSLWTFLPVAIFTVIYVVAAQSEERRFSASPLARDYEAYKRRAGFLWPRIIS